MTFVVNGIKEGLDKKYNIEFLLWMDSPLLAKKFLEEEGVIVLSLKEYAEPNDHFGNIYCTVNYQDQNITLVSNIQRELTDACRLFLIAGFDVKDINFFQQPVLAAESQLLIQQIKQEVTAKKEEEKKKVEAKVEAERKVYDDKRLEVDKKAIVWLTAKIESVITLTQGYISWKDIKLLKEKWDELKKLKMGTNHERIKELMEEITSNLEIIENWYYEEIKDQRKILFPHTQVTDVDVTQELNKLEKVKKLKDIGGKIKPNEQDYLLLDIYKIFQKFLFKDLGHRFSSAKHLADMFYALYDLVEIGIMIVIISLVAYTLYDVIMGWLFSDNAYYYQRIVWIWLLWLLLFGARKLRKKNIALLLFLIVVLVILYYLIIGMIKNNFLI
jgi:hypothetical protein